MSKHPQSRPRQLNAPKAGEAYHFDENPLRALTLEEALQDAKACYETRSKVNDATSHKRARAELAEINGILEQWSQIRSSDGFTPEIRNSALAAECDSLVAHLEQCDAFRVRRKYKITEEHWCLAIAIQRVSQQKQSPHRRLNSSKLRLILAGFSAQRRYSRDATRKWLLLRRHTGWIELQTSMASIGRALQALETALGRVPSQR